MTVLQPGSMEVNSFQTMADRDFIEAIKDRVVVFDGGMGATLEEFELTAEDYGGLKGKCHEALILNRPDVIEGVHTLHARRRRRGARDRHLPGQPPEARRVGPGRAHAGDQPQGGRDRPQGRGPGPLRGRLDRTDRLPAGVGRPDAGRHQLRQAGRGLRRAGGRPDRGRLRPADHRDPAGHPGDQGRDLRRARGVQADRQDAADPGQPLPPRRSRARCSSGPTSRR